ncbi:aldo/keto reductase [Streptomyces sp. NBC_00885]|uniref:aldo/keto reductase n=1 Tax=Streptomyces sp. NBC_00885 TaxID=2975857 RepID=UPI003867A3E5|nr:aldo/keto reductase [Streptomyces sp. NBC_00885]
MTTKSGTSGGRLLYGCMGLGGSWDTEPYGAQDIADAEAAIEAALDSGITTFDHADIYRHGKAEAVFGEVLARTPGLRERIVVQTKCGIRLADGERPGIYDLSGPAIARRVEESLARLRTDVIDVLLLHRPDPLADPDDIAEALMSLHRQGLVRRFGVSNMGAVQMAPLQARLDVPLVANQLEMSLQQRDWLEAGVLVNTPQAAANGFPFGTVEFCRANGISLQAWGALAQGRFTGRQETPGEVATARLISALADRKGTTPETILLWWLQRHPAAIVPVVGSARPDRIRACRDAAQREPDLSREEWYELWLTARGAPLP